MNATLISSGRMPLFIAPLRAAIRSESKTQTRRVINPQPGADTDLDELIKLCRYGKPGEIRHLIEPLKRDGEWAVYGDDGARVISRETGERLKWRWKRPYLNSIHMPDEAARTFCEILGLRIERLHDITEGAAKAEGCRSADLVTGRECILAPSAGSYRLHFQALWDSINKARGFGWTSNPWVFVSLFKLAGSPLLCSPPTS